MLDKTANDDDINTTSPKVTSDESVPGDADAEVETAEANGDDVRESAPSPVPHPVVDKFESFDDANLHPSVREVIRQQNWLNPTPVQGLCLPYTLLGRDVAGFAQTGTGKTGVFLITVAQRWLQRAQDPNRVQREDKRAAYPISVVVGPTRELAMQIESDAQPIFNELGIKSIAVFGGIDYDKQANQLRDDVDVIFATPGRLKDFFQKKIIRLDHCEIFVCDEADRMFDMGFIEDVEFFLDRLPEKTQKLLFSATTNEQVKELAFEYLNKPEYISVNPEVLTPELIDQHAVICDAPRKLQVMLGMLREHNPECAIVFTNTKLTAEWLHHKLTGNGIDADLITGDLPQRKRINLIQKIKQGKIRALIATDVASRGLHISRVTHVYNFDLPDDPSNYVHRIGRTARAGARGSSYSLVCEDYGDNLVKINEMLGEAYALKTEWFNETYATIEDKASNPYEDRLRERQQPRSYGGQGGDSRSRGPRHAGGGEHRGPRSGDRGGPRGGERGGGGRNQQQGGHQRRELHQGDRQQHGRNKQPRHAQPHQHSQQQRSAHSRHLPAQVKQPTSVFAMLKQIFLALFKRKS